MNEFYSATIKHEGSMTNVSSNIRATAISNFKAELLNVYLTYGLALNMADVAISPYSKKHAEQLMSAIYK